MRTWKACVYQTMPVCSLFVNLSRCVGQEDAKVKVRVLALSVCDTHLNPQPVAMRLKLHIKSNYLKPCCSLTVTLYVQGNVSSRSLPSFLTERALVWGFWLCLSPPCFTTIHQHIYCFCEWACVVCLPALIAVDMKWYRTVIPAHWDACGCAAWTWRRLIMKTGAERVYCTLHSKHPSH